MNDATQPALRIRNLKTWFRTDYGEAHAVDGVSLDIPAGKTIALVGESGCGKSVTALSIMRLIPQPPGRYVDGEILIGGKDLLKVREKEMRGLRGNEISMIFQEPMTSLNPVFRVGSQIGSAIRVHKKVSKKEARDQTIELLAKVGIPSPEDRVDDYPHQMSGGMRQRVMIAMALACGPRLLIADEPTTALDVTIQAQILELLRKLQAETGMAMLLITHDLGIVAETAEDVAIMYAGKIVEHAPVRELFNAPKHPYTIGLFESLPAVHQGRARLHTIKGNVPAATNFPAGCRFNPRCPHVMDVCSQQEPSLETVGAKHLAACWLHDVRVMEEMGRPVGVPEKTRGAE
jgi:peptide/nickel transport system ATP-binding protein/oligopeptide transport system ATP-binding protein